jgi:hypothetical protein
MDGEVLRDDQWEKVKPFVPGGRKGRRGPRSDGRLFFDARCGWRAQAAAGATCPRGLGPIRLQAALLSLDRDERLRPSVRGGDGRSRSRMAGDHALSYIEHRPILPLQNTAKISYLR